MVTDLWARFRAGDRLALSRLLSIAARGEPVGAIPSPTTPSRIIAFTGAGGVGKSSLVGKLLQKARADNLRVAVLACDPESPATGGALLGDRFRMNAPADDGVFIRSLATPSGREGLARNLSDLIGITQAFGFDLILLETVGAGQGDTAVRDLADRVVLLVQPEAGDDLQWEKAGILELADVIVVNKADLPGAEQTAAQVKNSLALSMGRDIRVLLVSTKTGQGIDELFSALIQGTQPRVDARRVSLARLLRERLDAASRTPAWRELEASWRAGTLDSETAIRDAWQLVGPCSDKKDPKYPQ